MEKPSAYRGDDPFVFVCYAHEDAESVYPEIAWMQAQGVNVWYDEAISLGTEWTQALADAIQSCTKFLFFVTPNSITREHCRRELNFAQEEGREVLAVHLQPAEVPSGLRLSLNNRQVIFKHEMADRQYRREVLEALIGESVEPMAVATPPSSSTRGARRAIYAVVALLVAVAGAWLCNPEENRTSIEDEALEIQLSPKAKDVLHNSIAVLPFDNLSPDPDNAYFAAGIHEEILTQLGKIPGLSVIARTTMLRYANSDKSVPQIASELNVQAIMAGSVRYSADQVRVTVQLVDAASGTQLWSDGYQERLEDVFDIQMAIARRIASTLEVRFSSDDPAIVSKPPTTNAVAYAHYLRANSMAWGGLNPFSLVYAELDRAIDADPEFASAYASKAFYQAVMGPAPDGPSSIDDVKVWKKSARENATRALDIDPNEARAVLTLGLLAIENTRFDEGGFLVERAYELAPSDIFTLNFLADVRTMQARWSDVVTLTEKMIALDPFNFFHPFGLSMRAWWFEEYAAAADAAKQAITLTPDTFHGYLVAAQAAAGLGDAPTAVRNVKQAIQISRQSAERIFVIASAASVYHQLNMPEKAKEMVDELEALAAGQYIPSEIHLLAYVGSSDVDMIVYWLELVMQEGLCAGVCLGILHHWKHQTFEGIRNHPKFRALIERV